MRSKAPVRHFDKEARERIAIEPISVRIPGAVAMTGLSRSRIYEMIKAGELEVAKDGSSTLIFVASLREAIQRRRRGGA